MNNKKLDEYKNRIKGKKIAVLGIGVSNRPLIRFLSQMGVSITAFDKNEASKLQKELNELKSLNIEYSLGGNYLSELKGFDIIFRTPGMRYDLPELLQAKEQGAEITSEMEVFFELCPGEIIGVTGSDGKTTTTTLIHRMLEAAGFKCWLGGNIGTPLLSRVEEIGKSDKVVVELSSFQLHTMKKSPHIAVITNLSPNHLDVHKSFEEYIDAKKNIFLYQSQGDKLVLNYDNGITKAFAGEAKGDVLYFSRKEDIREGTSLEDGWLVFKGKGMVSRFVKAQDIRIPGVHNVENFLAASAAVMEYVKPEIVGQVAKSFQGVEHRIEFIREINGIRFYNDSIASSPSRSMAGLNSFKDKVILIAGGKDKGVPYDELGPVIAEKVKILILVGMTGPKIEEALKAETARTGKGKDIPILYCNTYEEMVSTAYKAAKPGDVVILSPASTSFDMFKNFEERGNKFKELVNHL